MCPNKFLKLKKVCEQTELRFTKIRIFVPKKLWLSIFLVAVISKFLLLCNFSYAVIHLVNEIKMHKSRHLLFTVNKKMLDQSVLELNVKFDIKKTTNVQTCWNTSCRKHNFWPWSFSLKPLWYPFQTLESVTWKIKKSVWWLTLNRTWLFWALQFPE